MIKKEYVMPSIELERIEADASIMFRTSYTTTTSYTEDPSEDDDDYVHIHPDPITPTDPIEKDDDY